MTVTWTLKAADGSNLAHQPGTGSPLALNFNNSGEPHLSGYPSELIAIVEADADTSTVTIELTPDNSGYTLSESASTPTRSPLTHAGTLTWTNSGSTTTLTFSVPSAVREEYGWDFGLGEPPVALKMSNKIRRL
jgi:hypothetical protein